MSDQKLAALTIPEFLGSRASARSLTEASLSEQTRLLAIDASRAKATAPGAIDEIVKVIMESNVERAVVANANSNFQRFFKRQHDLRAAEKGSFLLIFQQLPEERLLSQV